jgi:hypothetical protein
MKETLRIGAGSGFWGDALDPAEELLQGGKLDYMSMDYLAELTMALLQRAKMKNPGAGYIPDIVPHMQALMPIAREQGTRLICNGGGVNPRAGAEKVAQTATELGLKGMKVALVEGDDLLDRLDELLAAGEPLANMETGDRHFAAIRDRVVAANVYTDSSGIQEALGLGADVVIAGRVSDNALYVGPIMHEFGWRYGAGQENLIGAAITAGHVMECAAACSGGMSSRFEDMPRMGEPGFPLAEFSADGSTVITKLPGTGGRVDPHTIKEHLVYEIADPGSYVMPDGIADFTTLRLTDLGEDRVRIDNMSGRAQPDRLKLIIGYQDGWIGEGLLYFPWPHALRRAHKARQTLTERFQRMGLKSEEIQFDLVGMNALHGPSAPMLDHDVNEIGLRVAVRTRTREEAEKVRRACTHLWIMGPGGTSFGAPMKPRPVVSVWPTLIPRDAVRQSVDILEA